MNDDIRVHKDKNGCGRMASLRCFGRQHIRGCEGVRKMRTPNDAAISAESSRLPSSTTMSSRAGPGALRSASRQARNVPAPLCTGTMIDNSGNEWVPSDVGCKPVPPRHSSTAVGALAQFPLCSSSYKGIQPRWAAACYRIVSRSGAPATGRLTMRSLAVELR